jgi:GTP cyclohydrolase II
LKTKSALHRQPEPRPLTPAQTLVAIDRAVTELRRGGSVVLQAGEGRLLVLAAEAVTDAALVELQRRAGAPPLLAITKRRAAVLGLASPPRERGGTVLLAIPAGIGAEALRDLADPTAPRRTPPPLAAKDATLRGAADAAVELTKLARLLPAALLAPLAKNAKRSETETPFSVESADVMRYQAEAALTLRPVSEARVPLEGAEETRIVAFRPSDGGLEHLAILIGHPDPAQPVLARLHSECFTGDLLGSLRCDCGDQLRGAIAEIARAGGGVLLYLAQEGRGIGLVNKLRAYELQDAGFDTVDANEQLGFDADERIYLPAAEMLRQLGFTRIRLLTNNPEKMAALARCGIAVAERVPHVFPANGHNERYLRTKATRSGHFL